MGSSTGSGTPPAHTTVTGDVDGERTIEVARAGDFVHIPRGETHGAENASETEESHLVFCYPGVPDKESADTDFVE